MFKGVKSSTDLNHEAIPQILPNISHYATALFLFVKNDYFGVGVRRLHEVKLGAVAFHIDFRLDPTDGNLVAVLVEELVGYEGARGQKGVDFVPRAKRSPYATALPLGGGKEGCSSGQALLLLLKVHPIAQKKGIESHSFSIKIYISALLLIDYHF